MSYSINKVLLLGNLGDDPEIRDVSGGKRVANFSLATSQAWGKGEDRQERAEWHRVVCWNDGLVDILEKYAKKGSKVFIEGELQTEKWFPRGVEETKENARYTTKVVMTGFKADLVLLGDSGGGQARDPNGNAGRPGNSTQGYREARDGEGGRSRAPVSSGNGGERGYGGGTGHLDDDIPFAPEFR